MQIITRMDTVVIEDYYRMTTMDEKVNWMKVTYLLSTFLLNLVPPFVHLPLLLPPNDVDYWAECSSQVLSV